jgi:hypothetical protein
MDLINNNMEAWRKEGREYVRGMVRKRDGHKCQKCKNEWKEGQRAFDVHHKKGLCGKLSRAYDRKATMSLLTTLCHKCHCQTHTYRRAVARRPVVDKRIAIQLRSTGLTYDEVGRRLSVSSAAIYWIVNGRKVA